MKTFALVLSMIALALPVAAGQPPEPTESTDALVQDYTRLVSSDEQGFSLMVVHLNDFTTDALFTAPTKYSLRAQARQNLMFFIKGEALRSIAVDTDYQVLQVDPVTLTGQPHRATPFNISNFEDGTRLSAGEEFQGVISMPPLVRVNAPFEVKIGQVNVYFDLSSDAIERLQLQQ